MRIVCMEPANGHITSIQGHKKEQEQGQGQGQGWEYA